MRNHLKNPIFVDLVMPNLRMKHKNHFVVIWSEPYSYATRHSQLCLIDLAPSQLVWRMHDQGQRSNHNRVSSSEDFFVHYWAYYGGVKRYSSPRVHLVRSCVRCSIRCGPNWFGIIMVELKSCLKTFFLLDSQLHFYLSLIWPKKLVKPHFSALKTNLNKEMLERRFFSFCKGWFPTVESLSFSLSLKIDSFLASSETRIAETIYLSQSSTRT